MIELNLNFGVYTCLVAEQDKELVAWALKELGFEADSWGLDYEHFAGETCRLFVFGNIPRPPKTYMASRAGDLSWNNVRKEFKNALDLVAALYDYEVVTTTEATAEETFRVTEFNTDFDTWTCLVPVGDMIEVAETLNFAGFISDSSLEGLQIQREHMARKFSHVRLFLHGFTYGETKLRETGDDFLVRNYAGTFMFSLPDDRSAKQADIYQRTAPRVEFDDIAGVYWALTGKETEYTIVTNVWQDVNSAGELLAEGHDILITENEL